MKRKNILSLINSAPEYDDFTSNLIERFENVHGGNYRLYVYSFSKNPAVSLLANNISDEDKAIEIAWNVVGLKPEDAELKMIRNYCTVIVTDNRGNIIKETPRRYFAG